MQFESEFLSVMEVYNKKSEELKQLNKQKKELYDKISKEMRDKNFKECILGGKYKITLKNLTVTELKK